MEILSDLAIDVLVEAPAYDDLFDIDEIAYGIYPVDYPPGGIIRRMPAAERDLYYILRFILHLAAGCQYQKANENGR
jgi:hypothetical protein